MRSEVRTRVDYTDTVDALDKWFVVRSLLGTCIHAFVIVMRFARRGSLNRLGMCAAGVADEVVLHALD